MYVWWGVEGVCGVCMSVVCAWVGEGVMVSLIALSPLRK